MTHEYDAGVYGDPCFHCGHSPIRVQHGKDVKNRFFKMPKIDKGRGRLKPVSEEKWAKYHENRKKNL